MCDGHTRLIVMSMRVNESGRDALFRDVHLLRGANVFKITDRRNSITLDRYVCRIRTPSGPVNESRAGQ